MTQAAPQELVLADAAALDAAAAHGLYRPAHEHDACGVGFVAHIKGQRAHSIIEQGLKILANLDHRGAVGADKLMGDGAGILISFPTSSTAPRWPGPERPLTGPWASNCRRPATTASA